MSDNKVKYPAAQVLLAMFISIVWSFIFAYICYKTSHSIHWLEDNTRIIYFLLNVIISFAIYRYTEHTIFALVFLFSIITQTFYIEIFIWYFYI